MYGKRRIGGDQDVDNSHQTVGFRDAAMRPITIEKDFTEDDERAEEETDERPTLRTEGEVEMDREEARGEKREAEEVHEEQGEAKRTRLEMLEIYNAKVQSSPYKQAGRRRRSR